MRTCLALLVWLFGPVSAAVVHAQSPPVAPGQPQPPVATLIEAAQRHDIVAVSEPHGNEQLQALLLTAWQAQTVLSIVTQDPNVRVFNVFTLLRGGESLPDAARSWPTPSLVPIRGTSLGARDFGAYHTPLGGQRVTIRDGRFVPVPREQWAPMPLERQFDALLYLGSPDAFTMVRVPQALCRDAGALARRMERLRFLPPVEAQRLREACEGP